MQILIKIDGPRWARLPRRRGTRAVLALLAALVVAVPVALASHGFGDVPNSNAHHDDISRIAGAGITQGCNPPANTLYCPEQAVRRDQMASFLGRGLGRVTRSSFSGTAPTSFASVGSVTITPGLPVGSAASARGFVKADASVSLQLTNATGCPCTYFVALWLGTPGTVPMQSYYGVATLAAASAYANIGVTGAIAVTPGPKTIHVSLHRASGTGTATASGDITAAYYPFGGSGGTTLGAADAGGSGALRTDR